MLKNERFFCFQSFVCQIICTFAPAQIKQRGVAQLVAFLVWDQAVAGSSPVTSTKHKKDPMNLIFIGFFFACRIMRSKQLSNEFISADGKGHPEHIPGTSRMSPQFLPSFSQIAPNGKSHLQNNQQKWTITSILYLTKQFSVQKLVFHKHFA